MNILTVYSKKYVLPLINKRLGEVKLGEKIQFIEKLDALQSCNATYVLVGIPEDIGVRANYGRAGAAKAWKAALQAFLNIQYNDKTGAEDLLLLGEIDCSKQMEQANALSQEDIHYVEKLGELVLQIDHKVTTVITAIVSAGKIPVVIGGGHNNSFGNLKGTSLALQKAINCINFDAHSDFRSLEHRHSGNGFSYAFEEEFLNRYFVFGLHRNYTSTSIYKAFEENSGTLQFALIEDIAVHKQLRFKQALQNAEDFCCGSDFGLEIDLDAIENFGSSAMTPSGFSVNKARRFVSYFSQHPNCRYIHICEGAPVFSTFSNQVAKAIAYLISDVIASPGASSTSSPT